MASTTPKVEIDFDSPVPLHEQVAAAIRRAIADGEAKPGSRLPPARDLAAVLGVNSNTVFRSSTRSGMRACCSFPRAWRDGHRSCSPAKCRRQAGAGTGQAGPSVRLWPRRTLADHRAGAVGRHHDCPRTPTGHNRHSRSSGVNAEALIKEARRRQRLRWLSIAVAALLLVLAGVVVATHFASPAKKSVTSTQTGKGSGAACPVSQLTIGLGPDVSPVAQEDPIVVRLTNRGVHPCSMFGYPIVTFLDASHLVLRLPSSTHRQVRST